MKKTIITLLIGLVSFGVSSHLYAQATTQTTKEIQITQTIYEKIAKDWSSNFGVLDRAYNVSVTIKRGGAVNTYQHLNRMSVMGSLLLLELKIGPNRYKRVMVRADDILEIKENLQ